MIQIFEKFYSQSKSIGWILSYLKTLFCVIDEEGFIINDISKFRLFIEFEKIKNEKNFLGKAQNIIFEAASLAKHMLIPESEKTLEDILPLPQLMILTAVKKMIINKYKSITFDDVLNHFQECYKVFNYHSLFIVFNLNIRGIILQLLKILCCFQKLYSLNTLNN